MSNKPNIKHALHFRLIILIGFIAAFAQTGLAQESDTTTVDSVKTNTLFDFHTARVEYFTGSEIDNFIPIDTTLHLFHRYNAARLNDFEMAYLGNLGAPAYSRYYTFDRPLGFDYGRHERDSYMLSLDELKYFRCNVPFTNLYYVAGGQGEQVFHVTHTRNFGKDFNFAIDFNKIISEGYFQYMKTDYTDVSLTAWYKTKNERYQVYVGGIRGKVEAQENGGIASDTVFELIDPASVLPLRSQALTNWDNWQGQITQQFYFGKDISYQIDDTTSATYFAPQFAIKHTYGITDYFYQFEDPATDRTYYGTLNTNPDTLRDRTQIRGMYNRLSFGNADFITIAKDSTIKNPIRWEIYGLQQWHEVADAAGKQQYNNLIGGINFQAKHILDSLITFRAQGAYDVKNNTLIGKTSLRFPKVVLNPEIFAEYRRLDQTIIQHQYTGFAYNWDVTFDYTTYMRLGARIGSAKNDFALAYTYEIINNEVQFWETLFTNDIYPIVGNTTISKIMLNKNFTLGNFHLNNNLGAQLIDGVINAPTFIGNLSWYYSNHLFESALFFQAGVDVWYHTPYIQYDYDIITGQWINQSDFDYYYSAPTEPTIDIFANFDVQTLRFFAKVDNAAQGLFSKGHYTAPNYPMQPRSFHLGLNWFLFY